jgi:hypothetical protein
LIIAMQKKIIYTFFSLLALAACTKDQGELVKPAPLISGCDTSMTISYAHDIVPILNKSCGAQDNACHTSATASGQVILDLQVAVNYIAMDGRLLSSITWDGKTSFMPLTGTKLPACDINKIRKWVNEGAPDN